MPAQKITDAQIAEAAFYIWLADGQPEGRDFDHWLQAQDTLTKAAGPKRAPRKTATTAKKPAVRKTAAPKAASAKSRSRKPVVTA